MPSRVCRHDVRHILAAGAARLWRPRLEETKRETRWFGVGVRGGGGAGSFTRSGASRDKQMAHPTRLFQRLQYDETGGSAHRGGHLCAGAHVVARKHATARGPTLYYCKWIPWSGEISNVRGKCRKGTLWARRCSASVSQRSHRTLLGRAFSPARAVQN